MNLSFSHPDDWKSQAKLVLPASEAILFRTRRTGEGNDDEGQAQLVWQRASRDPLCYLASRGYPDYTDVMINTRDDNQAIWVVAKGSRSPKYAVIASLDLVSGEFHSESVFRLPPPETAWAMVFDEQGLLIDTQLAWAQDKNTGIQRLWNHQYGLMWERLGQGAWVLKSGRLESKDYPRPTSPYRRQPPGWATTTEVSGASS